MIRNMFRTSLVLASCALLASCVSVLPEPKVADALYRISPAQTSHTLTTRVIIREPEAPRLFAGKAFASQKADGTLKLIPRVEWADSATRMLQIALLDTLGTNVHETGGALAVRSGLKGDYELSWRVSDFVIAGTDAHCQLELILLDSQNREIVSQKTVSTHSDAASDGSRAKALALVNAGQACIRDAADYVAATAILSSASE